MVQLRKIAILKKASLVSFQVNQSEPPVRDLEHSEKVMVFENGKKTRYVLNTYKEEQCCRQSYS